ncbi:MAG: S-adenosylmethionine:tRNA ribosyltransferase-isomerase, partial [Pseudomonadota bacterium]
RNDDVLQHKMHSERIVVSEALCKKINATKAAGGRVVAVGTTVVRALESAAQQGTLQSFEGDTRLFLKPGDKFHVIDALITNFHLPKSTLLMLVSAFAGFDRVMSAYREAVEQRYRFFSYGDAMLLFPDEHTQ